MVIFMVLGIEPLTLHYAVQHSTQSAYSDKSICTFSGRLHFKIEGSQESVCKYLSCFSTFRCLQYQPLGRGHMKEAIQNVTGMKFCPHKQIQMNFIYVAEIGLCFILYCITYMQQFAQTYIIFSTCFQNLMQTTTVRHPSLHTSAE